MKRIFITLLLSLIVIGAFAQEHLAFKGIPIEGSMTSFCQKLKEKGFTSIGTHNNIRLFTGDFTGIEATVGVISTSNGQNVFSVAVLFPESREWNNLTNIYDYYKNLYSQKYGKPTISKEENSSFDKSNTALMLNLMQGTAVYASTWEVSGGVIKLYIEKAAGGFKGQVAIIYSDTQNVETKREQDLEDI